MDIPVRARESRDDHQALSNASGCVCHKLTEWDGQYHPRIAQEIASRREPADRWNATVDDIEHADRVVIDLDPGEGVAWEFMVETTLALRELLKSERLGTWPKLTGSKGVYIMAPLDEPMTHDAARTYARELAQRLAI